METEKNKTPTFIEWLDKYYHNPKQTITYQRRDNSKREEISKLKADYERAYKIKMR